MANIYLNPLDWLLREAGMEMVRYADDMVVLCKSAEEAKAALEKIQEWIGEAGLTLHPQKTRIVDLGTAGGHFDFLGYRFWRSKSGNLSRLVRPKSLQKLRTRIKALTKRNSGKSMEATVREVNLILQGWYGYFKQAATHELKTLDAWVRTRLRGILRKRRKRKGRARKVDRMRWRNCYFEELHLLSLREMKLLELNSLPYGAKC